jgi:small-conductance mechanosensitive channel/CRP-like cAMP-binding protein
MSYVHNAWVLAGIGLAVVALLAAALLTHDRLFRRLGWGGAFWGALTLGYLYVGHLPVLLNRMPNDPLARAAVQVYDTIWWVALAWLTVQIINLLLWRVLFPGAQPGGRKLIADLLSVLIYVAAFLAVLSFTFDQEISGVLTASGVMAIVIGLALQTSLGEIVSGVFMSVEAPYRAGDWITIDDKIVGQVLETNWRATRLMTRTGDYLIVPNSTIAKANIVNHYFPDRTHTAQIKITVDPRAAPDRVMSVVTCAVIASPRVRNDPPPTTIISNLSPSGIEYSVTYQVDDFAEAHLARSDVAERIWRHLFWAGIRPTEAPVPAPSTAHSEEERCSALERALTRVGIFATLSPEERQAIAGRFRMRSIAANTTLVTQGDHGDSLFLISDGVLGIYHREGDADVEITRLGPGDYLGEMSLLTGAPRSATVRSITAACVHEIAKADLAPIMARRPALASELAQILATRQAVLAQSGQRADETQSEGSYAERIAAWIGGLFRA